MISNQTIKAYAYLVLSSILTALAVNMFFMHSHIAPGGITGLAIVITTITGLPVEVTSLCISIPLLICGALILGKSFGVRTLFVTLLTPLCLRYIPKFDLLSIWISNEWISLILSALVGGLLVGISISLALRNDCATGGTDVAALLLNKAFKNIEVKTLLLILDGSIIVASGFINHDITISILSLLSLLVIVKTIEQLTKKIT